MKHSHLALLLFLVACSGEAFTSPPGSLAGGAGSAGQGGALAGNGGTSLAGSGGIAGAGGAQAGASPAGTSGSAGQGGSGAAGAGGAGAGGEAGAGASGESGQGGSAGSAGSGGAPCKPGAYVCDGQSLLRCEGDPPTLKVKIDCPKEKCSEEEGKCLPCVPGELLGCFDANAQVRCSSKGTADAIEPCPTETPWCDKNAKGVCRECITDDHCPTSDKFCDNRGCKDHVCLTGRKDPSTPLPDQTPHDCTLLVCGPGLVDLPFSYKPDPNDLPIETEGDCFDESCDPLDPGIKKTPHPEGSACKRDDGSSGVCSATGKCGACLAGQSSCSGNTRRVCYSGELETLACDEATPACDRGKCASPAEVVLGDEHGCVILSSGGVECWGSNKFGQVGVGGANATITRPTLVEGLTDVKQLALGSRHTCALRADGTVSCWGDNTRGQLGGSLKSAEPLPVPVDGLTGVVLIAAGGGTSCAVTGASKLYCWGDGEKGQTFVSPAPSTFLTKPTEVPGAPAFKKIALGEQHGCGLDTAGNGHCWGNSQYTNITSGQGTKLDLAGPLDDLDVGARHSCARGSGQVYCWGENTSGKAGSDFPQPGVIVVQKGSKNGSRLALGVDHTCQIAPADKNFQVECFGSNAQGQLGGPVDGNKVASSITQAKRLAAGGNHTCALVSESGSLALRCWGANSAGQLGTGNTDSVPTPTKVVW